MKRLMIVVAVFGLAAMTSVAADTYYLQSGYSNKRGDGSGQIYTLTNVAAWATSGNVHPSAIQSGDSYVVASGRLLCLPAKEGASNSLTFPAKMRIGAVGGTVGYLLQYMYGAAAITWAGGIEFANGDYLEQTWTRTGNTQGDLKVNGDVTVTSPAATPFHISMGYGNVQFSFNGALAGASDVGLLIGAKPRQGNNGVVSRQTIRFCGDTSGYLGEIVVTSRYETITSSQWGMSIAGRSTLPGTTIVNKGCMVRALTSSDTLTLGTLVLRDGAGIDVPVSVASTSGGYPSSYAAGLVNVTGSFAMGGKAYVRVGDDFMMTAAATLPVLTVPAFVQLSKDDFEVAGNQALSLDVVNNDLAGTKTLVLKVPEYVYLTVSDVDSVTQDTADSSVTNASHWSDNEVPHSGANYYVRQLVSGTKTALALQGGHKQYGTHSFGGDSLTMGSGTRLYGFSEDYNLSKLTLLDGSEYSLGNATLTKLIGNEFCVPGGTVTLRAYCSTSDYSTYRMRIDMPLTGKGTIRLEGVNNTGSPHGAYCFLRQSPDFKGRFVVTQIKQNSAPKWADGYQEIRVGSSLQLGGNLPALDVKAVTLENFGMIRTEGSFTIPADRNRGIFVNGADFGGRITTGSTHEMAINTALTMNGRLYKEGGGTLSLGGVVKFGAAAGDFPIAHSNRLNVYQGTLKITSSTACDGLEIAFSNGTHIVLSPNLEDTSLTAYGVKNVKTDTPFVLLDGVSTLPFAVDWSVLTREYLRSHAPDRFRLGLLTVSSGAAPAVRAMFSASDYVRNLPGYLCNAAEQTDPETGDVTFALDFERSGMVLIYR